MIRSTELLTLLTPSARKAIKSFVGHSPSDSKRSRIVARLCLRPRWLPCVRRWLGKGGTRCSWLSRGRMARTLFSSETRGLKSVLSLKSEEVGGFRKALTANDQRLERPLDVSDLMSRSHRRRTWLGLLGDE